MTKPKNPYREGTLIWAVMEGDWDDLTPAQIAEVLDTRAGTVREAMRRIKVQTGYAVPHAKGSQGNR